MASRYLARSMVCAVDVYTIYSVVFCTCDAPPPKKVGRAPPAAARPAARPPAPRAPRASPLGSPKYALRLYARPSRVSGLAASRLCPASLNGVVWLGGRSRARLFSLRTLYI